MKKFDKILILSLLLAFVFCLYGIHWGRVESWNPDQMAYRDIFIKGELPFKPRTFQKPPFHTYFHYLLSTLPLNLVQRITHFSWYDYNPSQLLWSRLLTVGQFLGTIILLFMISKSFFETFSARIIVLIFSTSAGLIAFSHFLTTDIPVMFWMLLAFYFSRNILVKRTYLNYALAGFFTGIATATKYNGLAVGIAIVVAHVLSTSAFSWRMWKDLFFSRMLFLGLSMVIIGFLMGNPFAVIDYSTFLSDFLYNYKVTPVYGGILTGHNYWNFIARGTELIGYPALLILSIAFLFSFWHLLSRKSDLLQKKILWLSLSVLLLYYLKFGAFPRMETRFVLPILPFFFIMSAPFWNKLQSLKLILIPLLSIVISYNLICSFYVGKRFTEDPRMEAQAWVMEHVKIGSSIEATYYSSDWTKLPWRKLDCIKMPTVSGREKIFKQAFTDDEAFKKEIEKHESKNENVNWYSYEQLMMRRPDYIAINSLDYDYGGNGFLSGEPGRLYPSIKQFFSDLLDERYPYKIVFNQESKIYPSWIYPKNIDFLHNKIVIFKRESNEEISNLEG